MLALTRMVIRAGVLAALVATVMSVATAMAAQGEWSAIEAQAEHAFAWLADLLGRLGNIDSSVGDITLADLTSPSGWIDLGAGLFGGGEQPGEIGPAVLDRLDAAQRAQQSLNDVSLADLAELKALGLADLGDVVGGAATADG